MQPLDFILTAEDLIQGHRSRPRQANLRRAQSTLYYAMFHCLARNCADLIIGKTKKNRSEPAWAQVYRALEHGSCKNACGKADVIRKFPNSIQDFANNFVTLQKKRHDADYSPAEKYALSEIRQDISLAKAMIGNFNSTPTKDRRAFCALVLFKKRPL